MLTGSAAATAGRSAGSQAAGSLQRHRAQRDGLRRDLTDDREGMAERLAPRFGVTPVELPDAPHVLLGDVDQIAEDLERRRERFGFSYIVISGDGFEPLAPVVKKLAGT
jgi:alkanesulfonate monooxygenase SsuD/methylene tetrahydromethanopterin reductase-like flavin-dependent oxidoreductase (luciferase family)